MIALFLAAALAAAAPPPCLPSSVNIQDVTPFHVTNAQLQQIAAGLRRPSVVGLRRALDAYHTGKGDRETSASLKPIDAERLHGRFGLLADEPDMMGGEFLEIAFPKHLDAVYLAWMYRYASGTWVVRRFVPMSCSAQQLRWIAGRYRDLFTSPSTTI